MNLKIGMGRRCPVCNAPMVKFAGTAQKGGYMAVGVAYECGCELHQSCPWNEPGKRFPIHVFQQCGKSHGIAMELQGNMSEEVREILKEILADKDPNAVSAAIKIVRRAIEDRQAKEDDSFSARIVKPNCPPDKPTWSLDNLSDLVDGDK